MVTAARSGSEFNYSRFGDYMSAAITDPKADLDKDEQTSLLEAFLLASSGVREFYRARDGWPPSIAASTTTATAWARRLTGSRACGPPKPRRTVRAPTGFARAGSCSFAASARSSFPPPSALAATSSSESSAALKQTKATLIEDEYLARLEPLLVELAKLYENAEAAASAK